MAHTERAFGINGQEFHLSPGLMASPHTGNSDEMARCGKIGTEILTNEGTRLFCWNIETDELSAVECLNSKYPLRACLEIRRNSPILSCMVCIIEKYRGEAPMARMAYPSDLTDAEWEVVRWALPEQTGRGRRRTIDLREILNAIFYLVRTSCLWRYLPHDFPNWNTVRS